MDIDLLSDALSMVRLAGAVIFRVDVRGPWCVSSSAKLEDFAQALPSSANQLVALHVLLSGECWLRCPPLGWVRVRRGDAVVLPHGEPHHLGDRQDDHPAALGSVLRDRSLMELRHVRIDNGQAPHTEVLCGFLGCDRRAFAPLFSALPPVFVAKLGAGVQPLLHYAVDEALGDAPGCASLRVRIAELLFLESLREFIRGLPADATGWLAGLRDPLVGKALVMMHQSPQADWTVESLAARVACSRSLLAERFKSVIGEAPMHYLTGLRLRHGARLLRESGRSLETVANDVGYASTAAFQRAFKRHFGAPPGDWRRRRPSP